MDWISTLSYVGRYRYSGTPTFTIGVGYNVTNGPLRCIVGRFLPLLHNSSFVDCVYPSSSLSSLSARERELVKDVPTREHDLFNIKYNPSIKNNLENFVKFVQLYTKREWYRKLTHVNENDYAIRGGGSSTSRYQFHRLPFQQLMMLDMFFTLVNLCDVCELFSIGVTGYLSQRC